MEIKWIKISTDIFSNRKIKMISHMQDGDAIIVIWLRLLVLAGELNDGGAVYITESKPYTEELLAVQMEKPRELIALALRTFEAYGMIEMEEGFIYISNWEKYQNIEGMERIREQNRLRQQKKRGMDKVKIDGKMICAYCGGEGTSIDHVIPKSKGGSDDTKNLVCSCLRCNMQKTNRDLDVFLNDRIRQNEPVAVDSIINNPKLNCYVTYDKATNRFTKCESRSESRISHATDKKRIDKKREDKNSLISKTISQWQTNVDAAEANKEIRT